MNSTSVIIIVILFVNYAGSIILTQLQYTVSRVTYGVQFERQEVD